MTQSFASFLLRINPSNTVNWLNSALFCTYSSQHMSLTAVINITSKFNSLVNNNYFSMNKYQYTHISKINEALYCWYEKQSQNNIELNESRVREKALSINKDLNGDPKFNASAGWFKRWKIKYVESKTIDTTSNITTSTTTCCNENPKILFIEPFYTGSHKQLIDTLINGISLF